MKCEFVVGQQVVCINDDWVGLVVDWSGNVVVDKSTRVPMLNEVLTIKDITDAFGFVVLLFEEIPDWWNYKFFRPLTTRKTDISIFKAMLTPAGRIPLDA